MSGSELVRTSDGAVIELLARKLAKTRGFGPDDVPAWTAETERIKAQARLAVGDQS